MSSQRTTAEKLAELQRRLKIAERPGSEKALAKRAAKGTPSPRERIHMLLDEGSFVEFGKFMKLPNDPETIYGDGVVVGYGTVDGRPVAVYSHDNAVYGGSVGEMFGRKVAYVHEWAAKVGCPVVGINDSGGARIQDAVTSLAWYAELSTRQLHLSGMVPTISLILGKCAGGAVYHPANTDILVGVKDQSYMFVTGPQVIREVTGEDISDEDLGGAEKQASYGNLHHVADSEADAFTWVKKYLSYMPSSCHDLPPVVNPGLEPELTQSDLELDKLIPDSDNQGYDMHDVILRAFDDGEFLEVADGWAKNVITAYARVNGKPVGVMANQPMVMSGTLDIDASEKMTRFTRICNAFNIPLVLLVDVPGFLPGKDQESNGIIRRGGRYLASYVEASVPKVTVIIRKAYGGGYAAMGSKQLGADFSYAWPTARIAVMGAESAVTILKKHEIEAAGPEKGAEIRDQFIKFYNQYMATPYIAAERGYIDGVIRPHDTRQIIRKALRQLEGKTRAELPRKHVLLPV